MSTKNLSLIAACALLAAAPLARAQTAAAQAAAVPTTPPRSGNNIAAPVNTAAQAANASAAQTAAANQAANTDAAAVVPAPVTPPPPPPVEVVVKDATPIAKAAPPAAKGKDSSGHDTLSVDFPDTDIRDILRNVADLFELNLVIPDTLQGKTTIKLRDVTWRQIFQVVLSPVGYTYAEDGNIIKIISNDTLTQEPTATEVFTLSYARAKDIQGTIAGLIDPAAGGKIVVDDRSNSLIITERPTRMNKVRPIIETLDRATDQVMIEAKFVEITNRDIKDIGVNWASLAAYKIGASGIGGSYSRTQGQVSSGGYKNDGINGSTGANTTSLNTSNGTNGATAIGTTGSTSSGTTGATSNGSTTTGTVTTTNGATTATSSTGSTGSITNGTSSGTTNGTTNSSSSGTTTSSVAGVNNLLTDSFTNTFNNLASLTNSDNTNRALSALFSASEFSLVLSALQSQNDVKIVSNPTIVTLNNTKATINVGEADPIPKYQFNQQTGSFEVSGFEYKDIGIKLDVTPQVNARGFIKLQIEPEVSQKNGTTTFGGASGTQIPIIGTRKASTQVSLKDGQTLGIGGLLTTSTTKGNTRVPVLGSIPGLGRLFRSDSSDVQTTNLVIFITAKTVPAEGAPIEQLFDSGRVRQLNMTREDLPGYRDGTDPFKPAPAADTNGKPVKKK